MIDEHADLLLALQHRMFLLFDGGDLLPDLLGERSARDFRHRPDGERQEGSDRRRGERGGQGEFVMTHDGFPGN